METLIQTKLSEIAEQKNIKILYACETGSRAWGFPSPDSDYDVRIIYKHEPSWYVSLSDKKDTIEVMDGELDVTGWDVKKCLKLMWKSNGALLERLQSPIVYRSEPEIAALLKAYSERCFSPVATIYHYFGLAKNSFADVDGLPEIKLKKLFYALRATLACKWIIEKDSVPPIVFQTMVDELSFDQDLKQRICELVDLKSTKSEGYMHPAEENVNAFIRTELEKAAQVSPSLKGRKEKEIDLDVLFKQLVMTD